MHVKLIEMEIWRETASFSLAGILQCDSHKQFEMKRILDGVQRKFHSISTNKLATIQNLSKNTTKQTPKKNDLKPKAMLKSSMRFNFLAKQSVIYVNFNNGTKHAHYFHV